MTEIEVTWGRVFKVWWSLVWRAVLFGGIAGFIAGFVLGVLGAPQYGALAGMLFGLPIGIWVVKLVIGKSYSDFRLVLVPSA